MVLHLSPPGGQQFHPSQERREPGWHWSSTSRLVPSILLSQGLARSHRPRAGGEEACVSWWQSAFPADSTRHPSSPPPGTQPPNFPFFKPVWWFSFLGDGGGTPLPTASELLVCSLGLPAEAPGHPARWPLARRALAQDNQKLGI